ncbi:DUF3761 domain-containing protein [Burkholderia gladioli]|uniref:DUF3761 domain-containing protein n=2 Tax=Burkholderia gladioli TaxID=28095 RepID=A0A2A7RZV7_BURGA|nr:DUF3761 domain-containing protein [Burkholderia gladioli]MBU9427258.1 DUF3761 domain-containing protein [Burkholderia gladioli]PEH36585.1 hypothetical protein CRM94_18315 [Burkholderia gladioli]PRE83784.1 DUF3761 domain-containing protein [Burkholderia gladioli]QPQ82954.1 DUF3761 domain-containing protein [Burkholderia gladioli]
MPPRGTTMKRFLLATLLGVLVAPAFAYQSQPAPDESQLQEHGHYTNRDGEQVHSPAHSRNGEVPAGATARCRDGTYSFSRHRSGTCSRHGGVAQWQ